MIKKGFNTIIRDITSLKIQGAQNVAKEGVRAIQYVVESSGQKGKGSKVLINDILRARDKLFMTRETEPAMRNAVNYVIAGINELKDGPSKELIKEVRKKVKQALNFFEEADKKIVEFGNKKIKNKMKIYTHCHSSTVIKIIKKASESGKKISVYNTETRPLFQGRKTAKEIAAMGIQVTHYVDSAMRFAIKEADIVLIGADAITAEGKIINKVGSELVAETARNYKVPIYVCTNSWKFDPQTILGFDEKIEKRFSKEVWTNPPKRVSINNYAFEQINPNLIDGVVCELGVYSPENLFYAINKKYDWMF